MTIIKKMLEATTSVIKSRALKDTVPLIAHMHAWAERADAATRAMRSLLPISMGTV